MKFEQILCAVLMGVCIWIGGTTVGAEPARPVWLADCSVSVKEGYDNNVLMAGASPTPAYNPATIPAGSAVAVKDLCSWVTTVSPKIGINFSPLLGAPTNVPVLALTYAPEFAVYHQQTSESCQAHRALAAAKVKTDGMVLCAENSFTYIDGSDVSPFYPGGQVSAFGSASGRERREQIQERAAASAQFGRERWFFRPAASFLDYDLMTQLHNVTGYQNYCDRYDVNGGADLGCQLQPELAVTLGYRYGHQYQQQFSFSPYSASCDYQRVLAGVEGNPCSWLSVKMVSGPDFRSYEGDSATHQSALSDLHPVKYYGEGLMVATLAPEHTLTFKYKAWQWVSSVGRVSYYDSSYELAWHRQIAGKLSVDLAGRLLSADYDTDKLVNSQRHDLLYTIAPGLTYAINAHLRISLTGSLDWGRNFQDNVTNPSSREFSRQLVSLGTEWRF